MLLNEPDGTEVRRIAPAAPITHPPEIRRPPQLKPNEQQLAQLTHPGINWA
ncbi:hypothetical protein [Streptomyces violascens]|uniref:hypothetical protein n=1 Tax=Streptomyces violascens TaxID=67381 RepID=UPI00369AB607